LIFGIRPEDLHLGEGTHKLRVVDVENHGVEQIVTLAAGGVRLRATAPVTRKYALNEDVAVGWMAEKVVLFDATTGRNLKH
jgi:multiple sugar transport system ATP-binding protein